jgi:hypothetical protein
MVSSYAREQGYRYIARRKWPFTLLAVVTVSFGAFSLFALAIGFPEVAGIVAAYMVIMLLVVILFVILPVYALDFVESLGHVPRRPNGSPSDCGRSRPHTGSPRHAVDPARSGE